MDVRAKADEQRLGVKQVFAHCAPHVVARLLPPASGQLRAPCGGQALSISLFSAHFGLGLAPAKLGLDRCSVTILPGWITSLAQTQEDAHMFAADPRPRLPAYGIANYGAIDSGLAGEGPVLVTVVGLDRFDNWAALSPQDEIDRRERWLDAFQSALDRDHPGFSAAVSERLFLNARSMHNFMHTPAGAVYGFAPLPFERGIWAGLPRSPRTPVPSLYLASAFANRAGSPGR